MSSRPKPEIDLTSKLTPQDKSFKALFIPADQTQEMKEVTVPIKDGNTIEAMTQFVKNHIVSKETSRIANMSPAEKKAEMDRVRESVNEQLKSQPHLQGLNLSDEMIEKLFQSHNVDSIALLVNKPAHGYLSVNMYVDDQGVAKKLPVNQRATAILMALRKRMQVLGDAWIAWYYDDDDLFIRYDFTVKDLDMSAQWVKLAQLANEKEAKGDLSGVTNNNTKTMIVNKQQAASAKPSTSTPSVGTHYCANRKTSCILPATLRCSRCKNIYYCCIPHQRADWKRHKPECIPVDASTSTGTTTTTTTTTTTPTTSSTSASAPATTTAPQTSSATETTSSSGSTASSTSTTAMTDSEGQ